MSRLHLTDAAHVLESCRRLGRSLIKLELEGRLPSALDSGFWEIG